MMWANVPNLLAASVEDPANKKLHPQNGLSLASAVTPRVASLENNLPIGISLIASAPVRGYWRGVIDRSDHRVPPICAQSESSRSEDHSETSRMES